MPRLSVVFRASFLATTLGLCAASTALAEEVARAPEGEPPPPPPAAAPAPPPRRERSSSNELAPNSVHFELFGAGILYSVNYERIVAPDVGVRIGLMYLSVSATATAGNSSASSKSTLLMIPLTVSWLGVRSGNKALELGAGASFLYTSAAASTVGASSSGSGVTPLAVLMVGYRLQPLEGTAGFNFRVGLMALGGKGLAFSDADPAKFGFIPWPYVSFGASF